METEILKEIERISPQMITTIQKIVQMKSVKSEPEENAPFGHDIAKTLDAVLEIAQELGFQTKNLDHYIGWAQYGEGDEYIGIIGHLDVVPIGEGWHYPPFGATIENGYMYGRGVLDNKGPILSCLYALYVLKMMQIKLQRPIRIVFGCDEESGFEDLKHYLQYVQPPLMGWTPDCKYPVVYGERGRAVIEISAKLNHVDEFMKFVNTYFMNASPTCESLGLDFTHPEFRTNEMRQYRLQYQTEEFIFSVTFAYPPGISVDDIVLGIQDKAKSLKVKCVSHYEPVIFEKECSMVRSLQKAYEYVTHMDGTPVTTTGGTYAKIMPHIIPFGPSFPGQKGIAHLPDEWIKIEDLITNAKIYALGMLYLANSKEEKLWTE